MQYVYVLTITYRSNGEDDVENRVFSSFEKATQELNGLVKWEKKTDRWFFDKDGNPLENVIIENNDTGDGIDYWAVFKDGHYDDTLTKFDIVEYPVDAM